MTMLATALHGLLEALLTLGVLSGATWVIYLAGEALRRSWRDIHPKR